MPPENRLALRGAALVPQHISQWKAERAKKPINYYRPGGLRSPHPPPMCIGIASRLALHMRAMHARARSVFANFTIGTVHILSQIGTGFFRIQPG